MKRKHNVDVENTIKCKTNESVLPVDGNVCSLKRDKICTGLNIMISKQFN